MKDANKFSLGTVLNSILDETVLKNVGRVQSQHAPK